MVVPSRQTAAIDLEFPSRIAHSWLRGSALVPGGWAAVCAVLPGSTESRDTGSCRDLPADRRVNIDTRFYRTRGGTMGLGRLEAVDPLGPNEPFGMSTRPEAGHRIAPMVTMDKSVRIGPICSRCSILHDNTAHRCFLPGPPVENSAHHRCAGDRP
jgi:hypothetical protein